MIELKRKSGSAVSSLAIQHDFLNPILTAVSEFTHFPVLQIFLSINFMSGMLPSEILFLPSPSLTKLF